MVADMFRSETQARRFYELLSIVAIQLGHQEAVHLDLSEPDVKRVLAMESREGKRFRRNAASKIGVTVGGVSAVIGAFLIKFGPSQYLRYYAFLTAAAGAVFLYCLLSPKWLDSYFGKR